MKGFIYRLLLITGGLTIGALLTEGLLRLSGYEGDYERQLLVFSGPFPLLRKESWLLQERPAGPDYITVRDSPTSLRAPTDRRRILFLGDSGTYGWGLPAYLSYPRQLEKIAGPGVETVNAGVYGFNTCDALALYKKELHAVQADTLVLGLFMANDINFNLLCDDALRIPAWRDRLRNRALDSSALLHFLFLQTMRLNNRLGLFSGAGSRPERIYSSRISLLDENGLHMLNYEQGEIAGYLPETSALLERAYRRLAILLQEFQKTTRESGTRFVVLIIPAPSVILGRYVSPRNPEFPRELAARGLAIEARDLKLQKPTRRVLEICGRLQVECVDPTQKLRAQGPVTLRPRDDHPSADGHTILAEQLWKRLRQKPRQ